MLSNINSDMFDQFIKNNFPIIYEYKFNGIILLLGGAIRSIILNEKIKDIDFVLLTQKKDNIRGFINNFNLDFEKNFMGGYKIHYNDLEIDIFSVNDLFDAVHYDTDFLFYDLDNHMLISCGSLNSYKKRTIKEVNRSHSLGKSEKIRTKKLIKYIKHITGSSKRVKVKQKSLLFKRIKNLLNKLKKKVSR